MQSAVTELEEKGKTARSASRKLAFLATEVKNEALLGIAEAIAARQDEILTPLKYPLALQNVKI